jgi:hypothetical protein
MNLVKWNPVMELEEISNRLNSLFGKMPARAESGGDMPAVADRIPTVNAEFKDGMLNVTLPKSKKTECKSVSVSIA